MAKTIRKLVVSVAFCYQNVTMNRLTHCTDIKAASYERNYMPHKQLFEEKPIKSP